MTVSVETELKSRMAKLEAKVADLESQLDYAQAVAGIKRGLKDADSGNYVPAREWATKTRSKHRLPSR